MNVVRGHKYLWQLPQSSDDVYAIARSYNITLPIAQALWNRGYHENDALDAYLFSVKERDVAHPSLMKDAQKAVDRILSAINNKEKILIFGDYDVDGITSSSLMMLCLLPLGAQINFFLPHRVKDGYGLSVDVVKRAAHNGYKLIITVDNGITAYEPALEAKKLGIDLIITDHHRPHDHLPEAYAVIDPHQSGCQYPYKLFAGVGVSFKVLSLLYERLNKPMPQKAYELLLLGTVADVVPLTGENRFWVRHGLRAIHQEESFALKVLKKNGNVTKPVLTSSDIGYFLTPQINALGRLEDPRQGVKFLIGTDPKETEHIGTVLYQLNQSRKDIERAIVAEIVQAIEAKQLNLETDRCIVVASDQWPPGVIGLVASRLVGMYGKPTILLHITKQGIAKGSCRSIPAFNMFTALQECSDLLITFGGHAMAAGLSLKVDNIQQLKEKLEQLIVTRVAPDQLEQRIALDAVLPLTDVGHALVRDLHYMEPFGNENPQPTFFVDKVSLIQPPVLLKDAHVKAMIFADGVIKPIIFFNRPELFTFFMDNPEAQFCAAVQVTENHWEGRKNIELIGLDVCTTKDTI
jgi:single-stranded-DNA-specific exonuclease